MKSISPYVPLWKHDHSMSLSSGSQATGPQEVLHQDSTGHASKVRLWHATSSSAKPGAIEACCQAWIDTSEQARADRFRVDTSRNQHIVGRGMARRLLGSESVAPNSIRFDVEVHGKPYVTAPESAKQPFNLAHTDGLVMCGIGSADHELIGVDVERLQRRTDPELAERFFSEPEIAYLRGYRNENARRNAFLRIWTLKESFIKAIGTGLQTPLADFAFQDIDTDSPTIQMLNPKLERGTTWRFFSLEPRPGFIAAVAVATDRQRSVELELRCFDDLVL